MANNSNVEKATEKTLCEVKPLVEDFVRTYAEHSEEPVESWLLPKLQAELTGRAPEDVREIVDDITRGLRLADEKLASLDAAKATGRSRAGWFASEVQGAVAGLAEDEAREYLADLEHGLRSGSRKLYDELAESGEVPPRVNTKEPLRILEKPLNEYQLKDLAHDLAREAGVGGAMGAAIDTGFDVAEKLYHGEKVEPLKVVEELIEKGKDDLGLKAAGAGALKVAIEKDVIHGLPPGTPTTVPVGIADRAIENIKIMKDVADGKLTPLEATGRAADVTLASVAATMVESKGTAIGTSIGTTIGAIVGPIGAKVGGFVGGIVGKLAGSEVGKAIGGAVKAVASTARKVVKSAVAAVGSLVSGAVSFVGSVIGGIASFFGF